MKSYKRIRKWFASSMAAVMLMSSAVPVVADDQTGNENNEAVTETVSDPLPDTGASSIGSSGLAQRDPYYLEKLPQWIDEGASADHDEEFVIDATEYAELSEEAEITVGSYEGKDDVLIWDPASDESVTYEFEVEKSGLYEIHMDYLPSPEGRRTPLIGLLIDDEHHFLETTGLPLYRMWKEDVPGDRNDAGDEIRPMPQDISGWQSNPMRDSGGGYTEPLLWYLEAGTHTMQLRNNVPLALEKITFKAPETVDDYETVKNSWPDADPVESDPILIEAEELAYKNESAIPLAYSNNIASTPYERGTVRYNVIDGDQWSSGNQEVTWDFTVEESGYYKLGLRVNQSLVSNKSSFRTIMIDGKVPYEEMKAYRFDYDSGWQGEVLSEDNGDPYMFYLEEGEHTLSLRVTHAPLKGILTELEEIDLEMLELSNNLKQLTGGVADPNRTWNANRDFPEIRDRVQVVADQIEDIAERLEKINGRKDSVTQGFVVVSDEITRLLEKPNDLPFEQDRIASMRTRMADYTADLTSQPLQLDRMYVVPYEQEAPRMTATFWESIKGGFINFFYSFMPKNRLSQSEEGVLDIWMHRGRDYVNLLQQIVDENFTAETGIDARVHLLPGTELLVLMNAAGIAPDVALGMPETLPFEFAIRNGLYDLTEFDDFDEVFERFAPGSWIAYFYDGGYYGVPETQSFEVMFYRTDILEELNLEVPETWDDVFNIIPVLQQNNMNFNPVKHNPFFFQSGARYYKENGLSAALDTEQSIAAFRMWTEMNTKYAVDPLVASFYQHFRNGSIPIGIDDFNMYMQLLVAAPELNGYWKVAPIPGMRNEDGEIERWTNGGQEATIIFRKSEMPEEAWKFVKWWTSAETQERYGNDLELINGEMFRWNTSNIEAFVELPWKDEDLNAMIEQWRWYREIPQVPGSYFLEREIQNAWNRVITDGMNPRSSLEIADADIDRETRRKLTEFGFFGDDGKAIRPLPLPEVTKPWEGVDQYVRD